VLTLSLFRLAALLFAVTVKILIHQQSHFVVCFELGRQLLIELDVHFQRFGVQRVHGFFSLNAFLLGFPFGEWSRMASHSGEYCAIPLSLTASSFQRFRYSRQAFQLPFCWSNHARQAAMRSRPFFVDIRHFFSQFADLLEKAIKSARAVKWRLLRLDFDDS
jgi:hypothetical protein